MLASLVSFISHATIQHTPIPVRSLYLHCEVLPGVGSLCTFWRTGASKMAVVFPVRCCLGVRELNTVFKKDR